MPMELKEVEQRCKALLKKCEKQPYVDFVEIFKFDGINVKLTAKFSQKCQSLGISWDMFVYRTHVNDNEKHQSSGTASDNLEYATELLTKAVYSCKNHKLLQQNKNNDEYYSLKYPNKLKHSTKSKQPTKMTTRAVGTRGLLLKTKTMPDNETA